uniref:Ovule protein n=1 Tax=Parascaris univalens TaxID=6257 RepID=A0A914ZPQ1_PARUN
MTGGATVIAGEAPETDDEEEQSSGGLQENRSLKEHSSRSSEWKPSDVLRRWWSVHIDEKLEQRWRALGADVTLFTVRQSAARRKQLDFLKNATTNTQHIVHEVSFNVGRAIENLTRLEANVSLLLVGAKLVPDLLDAVRDCDMPTTD